MALSLILLPLAMAGVVFAVPSARLRPWLMVLAAAGHTVLTGCAIWGVELGLDPASSEPVSALGGWLLLDPPGKVVLLLISVLFLLCALYAPAYLAVRSNRPNRVLCACLLLSLGMMSFVALSHHLGLMWVAMEATTLTTAPCIYFNHNSRSLEATWKYLLVCSVGIALALFGSFFLAYSSLHASEQGQVSTLLFDDLIRGARLGQLKLPWLHAAFVLLLVGYGTKMGLAPMHTWKPDAYGEAPGLVGALLAGGMTSCAFLAILRFYQVCRAAGQEVYVQEMLIFLGLLSMAIGAIFMVRQRDFKRMLAYSSVEHMGILVIGIGIGTRLAFFGALLHIINNGLTKGVLFLSAGNIHRAYGSKNTEYVRGALRLLPVSGALFLAGFLAITGSPPFGPFLSEFTIVNAAFDAGQFAAVGLFLGLIAIVFIGMGATVLAVVQGDPPEEARAASFRDTVGLVLPILILMGLVLMLGLYIPAPLETLLNEAARSLEVYP
jgi:hydrogenase-4 component F